VRKTEERRADAGSEAVVSKWWRRGGAHDEETSALRCTSHPKTSERRGG